MIKKLIRKMIRSTGYDVVPYHPGWERKPEVTQDYQRLKDKLSSMSEIKLHFGCGARVLKGWINIDLFYEPFEYYLQFYGETYYPESLRGNRDDFYAINILTEGLPLPDNSVDIIFHEDFFEHLNQRDQMVFLAETLRVMKPGSVHRINTPNLEASMRDYSDFKKGREGVYVAEWNQWDHYSVIDPVIMAEMAKITGYSETVCTGRDESRIADKLPREYRPNPADRPAPDSNVFADLIK